ncbi:MAG: hypothetical protein CME19_00160 [Gemmatimonadetes bacterium]|nr:hypothetical protein [Gemmatimonadota bacterium]
MSADPKQSGFEGVPSDPPMSTWGCVLGITHRILDGGANQILHIYCLRLYPPRFVADQLLSSDIPCSPTRITAKAAKGVLLTVITLGLYSPYLVTNIRSYIFNNIWFGTRSFTFTGTGRDLFWPFIKAILIGIFTVQIYQFWFQAEKHRYFWSQTTFDQARFRSTRVGLEFMLLWLGNLALVIFTLGIAVPWVTVRRIRFLTSNLVLEGPLDLPSIEQDYRDAEATGEQIGDAFEFDMLDMGFGI